MRNTMFDASPYSAGLSPSYDATHTHFTYLDDGEITGGGAWMAQPGENLHVTIQNTNHTVVGHYFYNKGANSWRYHGYSGGPIPYGNHTHVNLVAVQGRAVEFAWPPGNVVVKVQGHAKPAKKDQRQRQKDAEKAKKEARQKEMEEFFGPSKKSSNSSNVMQPGMLKPVRFPAPPGGMVTELYMTQLITNEDRESLEYLYRSNDWSLTKWESGAWSKFLDWLTGPDS